MSGPVKTVIAEPSAIIRKGVLAIMKHFADLHFEVIEVADAEHLRNQLNWHKPDLLLVNPAMVGADSIRQFRKETESVKFAALVSSLTDPSLLKEYDETVWLHDSAEQIREKLTGLLLQPQQDKEEDTLSPREKEVIACVVMGMTNKQIAERLCLSTHTVITHRRNIASKLQIHSAAGLTIYAIVNKLVDLDEIKTMPQDGE